MPGQLTKADRQKGAREAVKSRAANKRWESAIKKALYTYKNSNRRIKEGEALDKIALELVACATDRKNPNFQFAVNQIGLRLDGKPDTNVNVHNTSDSAQTALGLSAAFALLVKATGTGEVIDGEVVMQDRSLLSTEVRPEEGGRGEAVGVPEDKDGAE